MALKKKEEVKDPKIEDNNQSSGNETPFTLDNDNKSGEEVKNETPETKTQENVVEPSIPMSAVKQMMEEMNAEFDKKLEARLAEERKMTSGRFEIEETKDYAKSIQDDYLDKGVTFFSYHSQYAFYGDMRKGKESLPPQGKVKFRNLIRSRRKTGSETKVVCVSTATIHSKEQVAFMRTSPYFGVLFHESINNALTVDSTWAQKLIEANQQIQKMKDIDVVRRCEMEGIPFSEDIDLMRRLLIEKVAKALKAQTDLIHNNMAASVQKMTEDADSREPALRTYMTSTNV